MYDVVVIGGGPAGMMAAGTAASKGKKVALVEKNKNLGKKLRITGKGRCNITNACETEELLNNVISNRNFLYSSFYSFTNTDTIEFFENLGVKTKVERGLRVFPESDSANDVADAMVKFINNNGVMIICDKAKKVEKDSANLFNIYLENEVLKSHAVIIATGGYSYQGTGSTGDGHNFSRNLGHTVTKISPSLVPLETTEDWPKELQGLSLKNVNLSVYKDNKRVFSELGEMLFTHFGVSGPLVLSGSCHIGDLNKSKCELSIDLKPGLTLEQLDKRICRDFSENINKDFQNSLNNLLPKRLISTIIDLSGISPVLKVNQIKKCDRERLCRLLKDLRLTVKEKRPINEAIITSGGISVKEINPSTLESKLVDGLFFAGEIIDVNAYTGGFNLQIAFSTGYLAGLGASDIN